MTDPPSGAGTSGRHAPLGIVFTLALMHDPAFRRPLQVQAQEPRPGAAARLTLVFHPEDRALAAAATQRLKTLLLRHEVQVDDVIVPGPA